MSRRFVSLLLLIVSIGVVYPGQGSAAEPGFTAIGIRVGIPAKTKHEYFHQYEAFAVYALPWDWRTDSGWGAALQVNASAGALYGGGETGFIGAIGPGLVLDKGGKGLALDLGPNFVIMDQRKFGEQDFGGRMLYMAHVGLTYRFDSGLGLGYRYQHMSNGGVYGRSNPGLDLHMAAVSWNF
jgi:hypothetical protein